MYNTTYKGGKNYRRHLTTPYIDIPEKLDWREFGVVGPVHHQGSCNSCWAFSAAGSLEYHAKKRFPNAEIDVQNILDCSKYTYGCDGGLMEHVFEYKYAYPLVYSYEGHQQKCKVSQHGAHVNSFVAIEENIEQTLPYLITKWGPTCVGVDFQRLSGYKGGTIEGKDCGKDAKHAVLVVGFTPSIWIVKNSLGSEWGDKGYAYLKRGENACAIDNTYASVATKVTFV